MTFDSNLAWKQASAAVSANREVLLALAGVFFPLPSLALSLLFPQPEPAAGMNSEAMMRLLGEYYQSVMPFFIPVGLLQAAGSLAILTIFTDRTRPTVGEAIRQGFIGMFPYVAALLLVGFGLGLLAVVALSLGAVTGSRGVAGVAVILVLVFGAYAFVRTSLAAPVVAVERERNPVAALRRSWLLTRGNAWRIALFYALVAVAFFFVLMILMALVGVVLAVIAGSETGEVVATVISSALGSVMTLYFVAIGAAVHRQLAGPSPDVERATFE